MTFTNPASVQRIERILSALSERPMTMADLCESSHISASWCRVYVQHLRKNGQIHISGWVRHAQQGDRMYPRPLYRAGDKPDAPKPAALTKIEKGKRAWSLIKQNPERHLEVNARRRGRTLKPRANPLTLWIVPT